MSPKRIGNIVHTMILETHINPTIIYCQFTGAEIGQLDHDELQLLFDSFDENDADDQIIDELYVRTICSMRPSPAWNKLSRESIERLRVANPKRVCAYLFGRYYQSRDKAYAAHNRSLEYVLQDGFNRIVACQKIDAMDASTKEFKQLLTFLLLIDAQFNIALVDEIGLPRNPLDLDFSNIESLAKTIAENYQALVERKAKLEKQAKLHESYLAEGGNRIVRLAANKSFMEVRPKSDATVTREKKLEFESFVTNIIGALMEGDQAITPIKLKPVEKSKPLGPIKLKLKG